MKKILYAFLLVGTCCAAEKNISAPHQFKAAIEQQNFPAAQAILRDNRLTQEDKDTFRNVVEEILAKQLKIQESSTWLKKIAKKFSSYITHAASYINPHFVKAVSDVNKPAHLLSIEKNVSPEKKQDAFSKKNMQELVKLHEQLSV